MGYSKREKIAVVVAFSIIAPFVIISVKFMNPEFLCYDSRTWNLVNCTEVSENNFECNVNVGETFFLYKQKSNGPFFGGCYFFSYDYVVVASSALHYIVKEDDCGNYYHGFEAKAAGQATIKVDISCMDTKTYKINIE